MGTAAKRTRDNRTITVDFRDETTYFQLLGDGKAFVEFVCAFLLAPGFQFAHKATGRGGGCLTRHSHYIRVRLGGLTIWRIQCTRCTAVFTILPHCVGRSRSMRPDVARDALLATHGGLSLELCAVLYHLSPMALDRLVCAFGHNSLVTVFTRCGLPLPVYVLADEKHSKCLTKKVYLPTTASGQVLWHLGYTSEASAGAFTQSYSAFQRVALQQKPSYHVRGVLTDGFDSTTRSLRTLFPGARLGTCLRHAFLKLQRNSRPSRHQSVRRYARSFIDSCTGAVSPRACGYLRWGSDCTTLRTTLPPRRGQHAGQCGVEVEGGRVRSAFLRSRSGYTVLLVWDAKSSMLRRADKHPEGTLSLSKRQVAPG
jgi:hypothetical protein